TNAPENPVTALSGIASAPTSGPAGPAGPAGAPGAAGQAGLRGPAGKNAKVTCTVKKKGETQVKVTCKVKQAKAKTSSVVAWRLTRHHRTVAHGLTRARNGRLTCRGRGSPTFTEVATSCTWKDRACRSVSEQDAGGGA